tara:strand:+ start:3121 stop:3717 length:597 start_codon:yes stop_codon:yes gene_type:complete
MRTPRVSTHTDRLHGADIGLTARHILLAVLCLIGPISTAYANAEKAAQQKCLAYKQYVRSHTAGGVTLTLACQGNTYNAAQWQCMIDHQGDHHRVNSDAIPICLKPAPMLGAFETNKAIKQQSPASFCQSSMIAFKAHYPNDKSLDKRAKQCAHPARQYDAPMWACMLQLARGGNSFHYAAGQCLLPTSGCGEHVCLE